MKTHQIVWWLVEIVADFLQWLFEGGQGYIYEVATLS
jgi:hypothetical protein